jgi:hypothetical protein
MSAVTAIRTMRTSAIPMILRFIDSRIIEQSALDWLRFFFENTRSHV